MTLMNNIAVDVRALLSLIATCAVDMGVERHTYIVGGAVRDYLLQQDVKDIDVVVEDITGQGYAESLANAIATRMGIGAVYADQYGVVHVGPFPECSWDGVVLTGQKVEIVTARREQYDRTIKCGSYKPTSVQPGTILEDLLRRDFTINTLAWSIVDVAGGRFNEVLDLIGTGTQDLREKVLRTPLDPKETFNDDPSRMLRGVRFAIKYGFKIDPTTKAAMIEMAPQVRRLPFEVLDGILFNKILTLDEPIKALNLASALGLLAHVVASVPAGRVNRAVEERVQSMTLKVMLTRYGLVATSLRALGARETVLLRKCVGRLPEQTLSWLVGRFTRTPIRVNRIVDLTGIQRGEIGKAVRTARSILVERPFLDQEMLENEVIRTLTS